MTRGAHRLLPRSRSCGLGGRGLRSDAGGALVEFLGVTVVVLVPLVYLIVAVAQVQSASYGVEAAAREAARAAAVSGVEAVAAGESSSRALAIASSRATAAVSLTAEDFGLEDADLSLECSTACFDPGSDVVADVSATVRLPGVPTALLAIAPLSVTVTARGASPVDGVS
ncbi:pilus assembly protein [Demequina sp. NBRC 110057]|uniref:pilus assembly protein n=1 Tax=Demequina sp. NBRC 110057 TaxID=1570346 RepID=UPI00117880C7|nr:pilus assembly protein [Demequina sp. NBRC 110057]